MAAETIAEIEAIPEEDRTPEQVDELNMANDDLAEAQQDVEDLTLEQEAAETYPETVEELENDIAELADQVEEQNVVERDALEEAANKTVTDELETALREAILDGDL